jgi:hypothetical protein
MQTARVMGFRIAIPPHDSPDDPVFLLLSRYKTSADLGS